MNFLPTATHTVKEVGFFHNQHNSNSHHFCPPCALPNEAEKVSYSKKQLLRVNIMFNVKVRGALRWRDDQSKTFMPYHHLNSTST